MSIGFSFTGKVRRKETLTETARRLAAQGGYTVHLHEGGLTLNLCPMGDLFLSFKREGGVLGQWLVEGNCSSTPAGAGLHKAAIELVDGLGLKHLSVDDETGYFDHRDFVRMRTEHFHAWLNTLVDLCKRQMEEEQYTNLCLCWNLDQYQPEDIAKTIVTPLGRFSIAGLSDLVTRQGIQGFARRFFLWDQPERDGTYYRNCALNALWEDCYFAPSARSEEDARINRAALDNLERAAALEPVLPLPRRLYRELCALDGREPSLPDGPELEEEFPIGFRRGFVTHAFGTLRLTLPGTYRYEWEAYDDGGGTNLWSDAATDSPIWRVSGYRRNDGLAEFTSHLEQLEDAESVTLERGDARWGWSLHEDEAKPFYQYQCEVISGPALYYITVTYTDRAQEEGILALLRRLTTVPDEPPETQTKTYQG